jgi:hypothetical protein
MRRPRYDREAEVKAWEASGQSKRLFAKSRGYSRSSLEQWIRDAKTATVTPKFVRVEVAPEAPRSTSLIVEIGGARIQVSAGFDESLLRRVIGALERAR